MSNEESALNIFALTRQSLDGSYIVALADYDSSIFTDSIGVMPVYDDKSLGGYGFDTHCVYFSHFLQVHFSMVRENYFKKTGVWNEWALNTIKYGLYDINANTFTTIWAYYSDEHDYSYSKEHNHRVLEISCTHNLTFKGASSNSTSIEFNNTVIFENNTFADEAYFCNEHFYIYHNGSSVDAKTGKIISSGGIEGLKSWWNLHGGLVSCEDHTEYTLEGVKYFIFNNQTVTNEEGEIITTGGISGLKKFLEIETYTLVFFGSQKFFLGSSGSVKDSEGNLIIEEGGKVALTEYLSVKYETVFVDHKTYYLFKNGTVYNEEWELFSEEGGLDAILGHHLDKIEISIVLSLNINNVVFSVLSNGAVINENGIKINIMDGFKFLHNVMSRNITLVTDKKENVYKIFPNGTVTNLEETEVITSDGIDYFLDFLFLDQDLELYGHSHESHVISNEDVDVEDSDLEEVESDSTELIELQNSILSSQFLAQATKTATRTTSCIPGHKFDFYDNGMVIDTNGTVVCVSGGLKKFLEYRKDICYSWKYGTTWNYGSKYGGTYTENRVSGAIRRDSDKKIIA